MDTSKILSADMLDILFDNRNKDYGAYELRKTYTKRITKALLFALLFVSLIFAGIAIANTLKPEERTSFIIHEAVTLKTIDEIEPKQIEIPKDPKPEIPQTRTEQFINIRIAPDPEVQAPPPSQQDLQVAQIGSSDIEGTDYTGEVQAPILNDKKDIIEAPTPKDDSPLSVVHVEAQYDGNWQKFLERNLNAQVPVDNNAPPGKYTVLVQFVVDVDGSISDIKVISDPGFGLDKEAIRVIKKSKKWEPAIYDGRPVKAYRKQSIIFVVNEEY